MSSANSSPTSSNPGGRKKASTPRSLSASQIARDLNYYETWSSRQNMDKVLFSDIPDKFKDNVASVMNVQSKIPTAWLDSLKTNHNGPIVCRPEFVTFLEDARSACPDLFSSDTDNQPPDEFLYDELVNVFQAWKDLKKMTESGEKYSEADFAKACDGFRFRAVAHSTQRSHCAVSLPQPLSTTDLCSAEVRVLNAKTSMPDNLILIPWLEIWDLNEAEQSPFKVLKNNRTVKKIGTADKSAFSFQSTPCNALPNEPGFEFASSVWEDKKPVHPLLKDAYRQNRMSAAAVLRHLHSLGINLPVFGLVWADNTVRAHVDWCKTSKDKSKTIKILSAPYPGPSPTEDEAFHEWRLDNPAHILQVHFLIRNIDHWTCHGFKDVVRDGIENLKTSIVDEGGKYVPWKRRGVLKPVRRHHRTTRESSATNNSAASPPRPKRKPGRPRK